MGEGVVSERVELAEAGAALQEAFDGTAGGLTAVLAEYGGGCRIIRFPGFEEDAGRGSSAAEGAGRVGPLLERTSWDLSGRAYRGAVRSARERIAAGDVYVVNLTARVSGRLVTPPAETFDALLARSGADMSAFVDGIPGETPWIASVSPERFVRVTREAGARLVEVCPIKGTRPRGSDPVTDAVAAAELSADDKELAEHVMVVDLERNDLGMVCATGSVHVDPLYEVVATPYCHQLVSSVRGILRHEATFAELLAATFPCGSITGAPKRAAMRVIGELEATQRGAYCGALLVAIEGELESSVLIRTLEASSDGSHAVWGTGCGITHDSIPAAEYLELLLKASPVLGDLPPSTALRETMRVVHGRVPLLERHLERLATGGCGPSTLARVRAAVARELVGADRDAAYARLGVTVTPDGAAAAGLTAHPSSLSVDGGPVVAPVEIPAPLDLPTGAAKPASRRFWDRAHRRAAFSRAHQALLHTPDGILVDGSTANVWLVRAGELLTPPAPPAIAGVARGLVFDLADELGIPAREQTLTLADFAAAEEVALSNAVGGFVAVRGRGGAITARIAQAVEHSFEWVPDSVRRHPVESAATGA